MTMTWKIFVDAIYRAHIVNESPKKIVVDLFVAAGRMKGFDESTAQAWIAGTRNCQVSRYFPDGKLNNEEGVFRFFRRRPNGRLQALQQIFRDMAVPDSPIDTNSEDMDVFCWSLVNQFLDLLGFQRLDIPSANMLEDNSAGDTIQASTSPQTDIAKEAVMDQGAPAVRSNDGAQLHIEDAYKCCRFCRRWKGTVADILEDCKAYKEKREATDGEGCKYYEPDEGRIAVQMLAGSKRK